MTTIHLIMGIIVLVVILAIVYVLYNQKKGKKAIKE
jgi:hypothetical protein